MSLLRAVGRVSVPVVPGRCGPRTVETLGGCPGAAPDGDTPSTFWPPERGVGGLGVKGQPGCGHGYPNRIPQNGTLVALIILNTQMCVWGGGGGLAETKMSWRSLLTSQYSR